MAITPRRSAEPPTAKVRVFKDGHRLKVQGRKAWCSGAAVVSHGLLTAWNEADEQQLVAVNMDQAGVTVTDEGWHAVGMADTGSAVQSLRTALVSREWPPADEATLRFRLADLMLMLTPPAFSTAEAEVQTVLDKFPGTTQAGDAESKRRELREKKFLASRLD